MTFPYRTALVTGASSGIGAALARRLARRGTDLVLVARREDRLAELAGRLRREHGVEAEVLAADLADDEQVRLVEKRLTDPERRIALLVNNAGAGSAGPFAERPVEDEARQVAVNLLAPLRLTRAVLPGMIGAGTGGVLLVSSLVSRLPMPGSATYGATKAALTSLGESLHLEVAGTGVHVTTLSAGLTHTEFHDAAGLRKSDLPKAVPWMRPDAVAEAGLRAVAAGRVEAVPGARNRAQLPMLALTPRRLLRKSQRDYFGRMRAAETS